MSWHAKEVVRSIYDITDPALAIEFGDQLAGDLQNPEHPIEVRSLERTIERWKTHITALHQAFVSNGPTEAVNNLVERSNESASDSAPSPTTESEYSSTPATPTRTCSPASTPPKSDEPVSYRSGS